MIIRMLFLAGLAIASCLPLSGATGAAVGVMGGVVMTRADVLSKPDRIYSDFTVGAIVEIPIYSILSARTGVQYRGEGVWFGPFRRESVSGEILEDNVYQSEHIGWVEFPVMLKVTPFDTPLRPYALAGVTISTVGKASYDFGFANVGEPVDNSKEFKGTVGLTFGAGAAYDIPDFAEVFLEGRYIAPADIHRKVYWTHSSVAVATGLQIRL